MSKLTYEQLEQMNQMLTAIVDTLLNGVKTATAQKYFTKDFYQTAEKLKKDGHELAMKIMKEALIDEVHKKDFLIYNKEVKNNVDDISLKVFVMDPLVVQILSSLKAKYQELKKNG